MWFRNPSPVSPCLAGSEVSLVNSNLSFLAGDVQADPAAGRVHTVCTTSVSRSKRALQVIGGVASRTWLVLPRDRLRWGESRRHVPSSRYHPCYLTPQSEESGAET